MRNTIPLLFTSLLFFLIVSVSVAQSSCMVTHYSRSQYSAGSQNWSIDMDKQGFVYAANNNGLMKYDGVRWIVYPMPARTIVRSVSISPDDRIYVGSNEEFGYWTKDASNDLAYTSLVPLLKNFDLHNHEIWKIVQQGNKVYFQGFSCLFVYDQKTVKSISLPRSIVFLLKAGNRLFVQAVEGNLFEVINDKLVNIDYKDVLINTEVKTILPFGENFFLIGTSSDGLFIFNGKTIIPWNVKANPMLKEYQINNGIVFGDKLVFGTIVKGVFILDKAGNILYHLYSENELQNNTVLSLCNYNNQSIWVGLDNGIDNISLNNTVDIYTGRNEALGAVYTAALKDNTLYIGTNRGIFTYKKEGDQFFYHGFLQNSQGQVWQLKEIDGTLFCGHNDGTFTIENNVMHKISDVRGGYMLQKIQIKGMEYLIQSTYTSLVLYKKAGNSWIYSHQIDGFLEPARFIEADHLGNIWIGHSTKRLYRLRLSETLDNVTEKQVFGDKDGIPTNTNIRVYKIASRVVFSNGEKLFTWDDLRQKITPYTEINSKLQGFETASTITTVDENKYWFATIKEAALFSLKGNIPVMLYRLIFTGYSISLVDNYENIVALTKDLHLICLDNGFAIFKETIAAQTNSNASTLIIRDFVCSDANGNTIKPELSTSMVSLRNAYNNIAISFSTIKNPCLRKLYQFKLQGIESNWSNWSESAEANYTRLPVGEYTFMVRTLNSNGSVTEPVLLKFKVKQPWYASFVAMLLYIIILLGGILASQYFYRKRLAKHHDRLHMIADDKRKAEKQKSQQEIMRLQNEKLQAEISHKNMQLADSTLSIIKKNEVLIEIKDELEKQKENLGARYPARYLQKLTTLIDKNISNDNDWEMFESLFDQAHENFFKRLKQSFPDLTQSDLKLCAYLKLNLSSKEIAPLLNISIRGVEIRRYRLRKRLSLSSDNNLVEYIMQF